MPVGDGSCEEEQVVWASGRAPVAMEDSRSRTSGLRSQGQCLGLMVVFKSTTFGPFDAGPVGQAWIPEARVER